MIPKLTPTTLVGIRLAAALSAGLWLSTAAQAQDLDSGGNCEGGSGSYADAVLGFESGGDQFATNPNSTATGTYQVTYGKLVDYGYIVPGQSTPAPGAGNWPGIVWTGKGGINSREQFMASAGAQAQMLYEMAAGDLNIISGSYTPGQSVNGVQMTTGGAALAAHMLGAGGFNAWAASGFSASGLSADLAAAHGWSQQEYLNHIMERVAAGGCFDPTSVVLPEGQDGTPVQDLPVVFLMPWEVGYRIPAIVPGSLPSTGR